MNPEDVRRALLEGREVDWSEIDNSEVPEEELLEGDRILFAHVGTSLPDGWRERAAQALSEANANVSPIGRVSAIDRLRATFATTSEAITSFSLSSLDPQLANSLVMRSSAPMDQIITTLEFQDQDVPIRIGVSQSGRIFKAVIEGIEDEDLGTNVRLVHVSKMDHTIVSAPTSVRPNEIAFEVELEDDSTPYEFLVMVNGAG
jgi:hypothetical protein